MSPFQMCVVCFFSPTHTPLVFHSHLSDLFPQPSVVVALSRLSLQIGGVFLPLRFNLKGSGFFFFPCPRCLTFKTFSGVILRNFSRFFFIFSCTPFSCTLPTCIFSRFFVFASKGRPVPSPLPISPTPNPFFPS